ncbi:MAG: TlpA family protein disulfide reductase [Candidatus Melainabacteria bacterium]|jgi:thiol-disulfide isomerase/thioredoxin|nr:redoxin domain-containing protein [Candidatus Obscuribacterales bacterium]PZM77603.1 MAG: TlpA family protein disulfide reductase [Candidatus Melainabacteria bacterium]HNB22028.1 redoxin domain-containing protein [Candidatus Melainabacteria bacterium]
MPLRMDAALPSIEGGTEWFNSPPIKNDELKGVPVLIHFWAISCGICKESLPEISGWLDKYGSKGLKIVSVHMPRQESDTNIDAVKEAINEYEVKQPCVVDNWHEITDGFENKYVPAFYLFDEEGKMRQFNAGEKAAKLVESAIERVINAYTEKKEGAKA